MRGQSSKPIRGQSSVLIDTWRMVILGSGHGNVDASDTANYQEDCRSLGSDQERAVALTKAEELFRDIYKRELPVKTLLQ
jgi:hypothetical protein